MFNSLASYLLGTTAESVPTATEVRLTSIVAEDDWVLIDRSGSAGESDVETSLESLTCDDTLRVITRTSSCSSLQRSSSCSSLPCTSIEESWFMTPPPCFTSAGPIHMETSPLENLLIEHPSMSVYQHSTSSSIPARRHNSVPNSISPAPVVNNFDEEQEVVRPVETAVIAVASEEEVRQVEAPPRHRPHTEAFRQQERQCLNVRNAQKVKIQKACQTLKKSYLERNNKAREVNFRNRRQRRGERSQGAYRSNANNNRKC